MYFACMAYCGTIIIIISVKIYVIKKMFSLDLRFTAFSLFFLYKITTTELKQYDHKIFLHSFFLMMIHEGCGK